MSGHALMKKLQLRGRPLVVLGLPAHLEPLFPKEVARVDSLPEGAQAVLGFAADRQALAALVARVLPGLDREAVHWLAYPKKSSRCYRSDLTRDQGWAPLLPYNYEPVSQVALDEDWSALRFKPFDLIDSPSRRQRMVKDS